MLSTDSDYSLSEASCAGIKHKYQHTHFKHTQYKSTSSVSIAQGPSVKTLIYNT